MQTPVSKRRVCFRTRINVCAQFFFSHSSLSVPFLSYECSKIFFICFWQRLQHLLKKRESLIVFFFFRGGSSFWQRKFWPNKSVFIITTQPSVLLLDFASIFRVNLRIIIINLRKWQVLFKKPAFWEKVNLSDQETWELFPFFAQI